MQFTTFTAMNSKILPLLAVFLFYPYPVTANPPELEEKQRTDLADNKTIQSNAYALLIGINKYKHVRDLQGAVNDVENIKRLLVDSFNFVDDEQHIKVLTDEHATRKAILNAIENHLIAKANQNSVIVLHYSGHGSRVKDVSGDEADGYDETIVPHDSGRKPHANKDITDDELNLLLDRLATLTPNVTFIFDSCHSGTATRASGLARTIPNDERSLPVQESPKQQPALSDNNTFRTSNSAYVLISGSAANEESLELRKNDQTFGAMTWFLTDQIRQAGANATYRDVMDIVKAKVSTKYPSQHPQLEGTGRDRLVFNTRSVVATPYILVTPTKPKQVILRAGQVHGVNIDSIYDIFPPGVKTFTDTNKSIAKIKVTKTYAIESYAEVISGDNIPEGSRAIERQHNHPNQILRVFLKDLNSSKTLSKIKQALSGFKHIKIIKNESDYDILLREHLGHIITEAGDPTEISPRIEITKPNVVNDTVKQVTQWGKWFNILNINNINPNLNIKFNIETDNSSEQIIAGTEFNISIQNNSTQRLYIALIDLSSDGQISLVFPKADGKDYIAPGLSLNKRLRAYLPKNTKSIRDVLKIIATTEPTDYRFLEQPPLRNASSLEKTRDNHKITSPFEEFIANAAIGTTRGQTVAKNSVNPGNWVTLERTIKVIRH